MINEKDIECLEDIAQTLFDKSKTYKENSELRKDLLYCVVTLEEITTILKNINGKDGE